MIDNTNASLLTNATALATKLQAEEAELTREVDILQVKLEIVRDHLATLQGKNVRRGRPPRVRTEPSPAEQIEPMARALEDAA